MSKSVAVKQDHAPAVSEGSAVLSMIERLASDPNADDEIADDIWCVQWVVQK